MGLGIPRRGSGGPSGVILESVQRGDRMVKGIARRVVVVKSPDPDLFDEAIFIVREETSRRPGVTGKEILSEAMAVAETYVRGAGGMKKRRPLPPWAWSLSGGAAVGLMWLITALF